MAGPVNGLPLPGYAAAFALLAGLSCLAPFCVTGGGRFTSSTGTDGASEVQRALRSIAIDHASRNPGRNGVTVSALMVGLAIMIGVIIMVRSFRHTVELWINETVMADVVVAPPTWLRGTVQGGSGRSLPPDWEARLAQVPGCPRSIPIVMYGARCRGIGSRLCHETSGSMPSVAGIRFDRVILRRS
ncbi:MAG: hypothetical protein U0231_11505 [Nitrospiraceae bacterium]